MAYGKGLITAIVGVMSVTLLSKMFGFMREVLLAAQLGVTSTGDAFKVATYIPMTIFTFVASCLVNTFIPLLTEQAARDGTEAVKRYVANVNNVVSVLLVISAGLGMLLNPWIVKLVAPGFNHETYQLTVELTYWLMPLIVLLGLTGVTSGYLNFRQVFVIPQMSGLIFNLLFIGALIALMPRIGVYGAVIGMTAAYAGQVIFLMIVAWHYGYRFRFILDWGDPYLRRMFKLALPIVIGMSGGFLASLVDRIFASSLAQGSIAALDYATRFHEIAMSVVVSAIGGVYFPTLSQTSAVRDWPAFREHLLRAVSLVLYSILPVATGLMVLAEPIISLFFERGAFDARATAITATYLLYYSMGLMGFALRNILDQAYVAIQDTVTPVINGTLMIALNVAFNFILVKIMGLGGIALSTSLAATLMMFPLARRLQQKVAGLTFHPIKEVLRKSGLAVLMMAMAVKGCDWILSQSLSGTWGLLLRVGLSVGVGVAVYVVSLWYLRVPEVQELLKWTRQHLKLPS